MHGTFLVGSEADRRQLFPGGVMDEWRDSLGIDNTREELSIRKTVRMLSLSVVQEWISGGERRSRGPAAA